MKIKSPLLIIVALAAGSSSLTFAQTSASAGGNWSVPATWTAGVPVNGAAVGIGNGKTVNFLAGNSWTGGGSAQGLIIGYGPWAVTNWGVASPGNGILRVSGGTLNTGFLALGDFVTAQVGTLTISGGAVTNSQDMIVSWGGAGSAINVSGGIFTQTAGVFESSIGKGAAGSFNVSGMGTANFSRPTRVSNGSAITLAGTGTINSSSEMIIGEGPGANTMTFTGGTFNSTGSSSSLRVGNLGTGVITLNGGTLAMNTNPFTAGFGPSASGTLTVGTGSVFSSNTSQLIFGTDAGGAGATGTLNLSGGTLSNPGGTVIFGTGNATGVATHSLGTATLNDMWLGNGGTGTYNQSGGVATFNEVKLGNDAAGTGIYNQSGGTATAVTLQFGNASGLATSTYNQSNGTATWGSITTLGSTGGNYNLSRGTLRAGGNLDMAGAAATTQLNITGSAGSVIINTNGFALLTRNSSTFDKSAASLTKSGTGKLHFNDGNQLTIKNGSLIVTTGTLETDSNLTIGTAAGNAAMTVSGTAIVRFGYPSAASLLIGTGAGSSGALNQTGGRIESDDQPLTIGDSGGTGTQTLTGTGVTDIGTGIAYIGRFSGSAGTLNVTEGSFLAGGIEIAASGATSGVLNISTGQTVTAIGNTSIGSGGLVNAVGTLKTAEAIFSTGSVLRGTGTINGKLTAGPGSQMAFVISTAPGTHNSLAVTGTAQFDTTSTVVITSASGATAGAYTLIDGTSTSGSLPALVLPFGWVGNLQIASNDLRLVLTTVASAPYDAWSNGSFTNDLTNKNPTVDFDKDGLANLLEFVLGGDPTISDVPSRAPTLTHTPTALVVTFGRSDSSENHPIDVRVQVSENLMNWSAADEIVIGPSSGSGPNGATYTVDETGAIDTVVVTIPKGMALKKFARVFTTKP